MASWSALLACRTGLERFLGIQADELCFISGQLPFAKLILRKNVGDAAAVTIVLLRRDLRLASPGWGTL